MKWNAIFAGIALIAVIICLDTCQQSKEQSNLKEAAQSSNERLLKRLAHEDSEKALRDTFIVHQTKKLYNDSVRHGKVQKSLLSEIKRLKSKPSNSMSFPEWQVSKGDQDISYISPFKIDTTKWYKISVVEYTPPGKMWPMFGIDGRTGEVYGTEIWDRDSVIRQQDSLITDLTNERDSLRLGFNPIIDSLKANIESEHQKFLYTLHDRDSILNRPEKPNSPISFGASIGPGVVFTPSGQVHGGMTGNIGLNIKIPLQLRNPFKRKR